MKTTFDKEIYKKKKSEIIELIKISLPDWEKTQGFVADGIFSLAPKSLTCASVLHFRLIASKHQYVIVNLNQYWIFDCQYMFLDRPGYIVYLPFYNRFPLNQGTVTIN